MLLHLLLLHLLRDLRNMDDWLGCPHCAEECERSLLPFPPSRSPSFPRFKLIMAAVFMSRVIVQQRA